MSMKALTVFTIIVISATLGEAAEAASGPVLKISPDPVSFPLTQAGGASYASVTITNEGTSDLTITKLATYGYDLGNFGVSGDGCTGFTVPSGGFCNLELEFGPAHYGRFVTWMLIYDNATGSPQHVRLQGCERMGGSAVMGSSAVSSSPKFGLKPLAEFRRRSWPMGG